MEKNALPGTPADPTLPRPIVLQAEDLATIAAAGLSLATTSMVLSKPIIAGGIPANPYLAMGATAF